MNQQASQVVTVHILISIVIATLKIVDQFDKKLQNEYSVDIEKLEEIIQDNCRMCNWIDECDRLLKRICAVVLATNIPLTTIQIYIAIVDPDASPTTRLQVAAWILGQICQIVAFSSAAAINRKSENFYNILYRRYVKWSQSVDFAQANVDVHLQRINLLLNRMATQKIGFTVWDLILINKSTLLTTFSLVFTYFMLVIQFAIPMPTSAVCICNCSNVVEN